MTILKKCGVSIRIAAENPNHHLYLNNGGWWIHYTVHPTSVTTQRVRRSLKTRNVAVARQRRDRFFAQLGLVSASRTTPKC